MLFNRTVCLSVFAVLTSVAQPAMAQGGPMDWTGPYAGFFGGYGTGHSAQDDNGYVIGGGGNGGGGPSNNGGGGTVNADGAYRLSGATGGGLLGYSYQFNAIVVGLEGDIGAAGIDGSSDVCGTPAHVCGTQIRATSDIRGRIGYAFGSFLPYIAGGLAVDHIRAYDTLLGVSGAAWRAGYTIGGGVEYKATPAISLRLEYLHADFGTAHLYDIVPGTPERVSARTDIVRAGVTFSLASPPPAPIVAKY